MHPLPHHLGCRCCKRATGPLSPQPPPSYLSLSLSLFKKGARSGMTADVEDRLPIPIEAGNGGLVEVE